MHVHESIMHRAGTFSVPVRALALFGRLVGMAAWTPARAQSAIEIFGHSDFTGACVPDLADKASKYWTPCTNSPGRRQFGSCLDPTSLTTDLFHDSANPIAFRGPTVSGTIRARPPRHG